MIKNVRPNTKLRTSSAPPGPAPLDSNWDDDEKTVPGLDLDDPMNEFDRVTAIPDLPPEQYAKSVMAAAEDSRVPLPGTAPPEPPPPSPPSAPSAPIQSLAPDEYFSLESDPPPSPRSPDSTAPYAPVLPHNAPTARPAAPTLPSGRSAASPLPPTRRGVVNFDQLDSLSAPARQEGPALDVPPPAAAFKEVPSTASAIADMKDRYAMGDFSGALVIAEGILETSPGDPEAPRYAQSCRDVLTQMYSARLGSLDQRVRVAVPSDQIRWLTLDHRAGFLLSLADGGSTIDQILDISGMPRLDALRIMYQLLDQRVISLGG
ncbi:MAG TPA: hypothetical protein VER96_01505 [Polyangiaceae bacterium]|nr:hypothetical protein [Polyangiaceae bacterium]